MKHEWIVIISKLSKFQIDQHLFFSIENLQKFQNAWNKNSQATQFPRFWRKKKKNSKGSVAHNGERCPPFPWLKQCWLLIFWWRCSSFLLLSFLSFPFFSPFIQAQRPCNYRDAALTRVGLDGVLQEHYNALSSSTSVFEAGAKRLAGRIALNDFLFHEALPYFFSPNGIPYRQSLSLQYFCPYRVCVSSVLSLLLKAKISKNFWDYNDILLWRKNFYV